jgi:hypothetical protein
MPLNFGYLGVEWSSGEVKDDGAAAALTIPCRFSGRGSLRIIFVLYCSRKKKGLL